METAYLTRLAAQIALQQAYRAEDAARAAHARLQVRLERQNDCTRLRSLSALQLLVDRMTRLADAAKASAAARRRLYALDEALLELEGL